MEFKLVLLSVEDITRSIKFYSELFDQHVVLDLGKNITFSGGFAIQENFAWLTSLEPDSIVHNAHNMELYFEVDDFDQFLLRLKEYSSIKYVHPPKMHEWKQRVVRIYDPDGHMIEIGESMTVIARRYLKLGYTVQETAEIIQHPVFFVEACNQSGGDGNACKNR